MKPILVVLSLGIIILTPQIMSGARYHVNMVNYAFVPDSLIISYGDTVVWYDIQDFHTTTSGVNGVPDGLWDSGFLSPGDSFAFAFDTLGTFPYYCTPHWSLGMVGLVTVTQPNVDLNLTPYNPPIQIPSGGGSFTFNIAVSNNSSSIVNASVWFMVRLPNGAMYGPVLGPVNLVMPQGFSINRDRTQSVPGVAPAGLYTYFGYIGIYPNPIWDADSFNFTKLGLERGMENYWNWENTGESLVSSLPMAQ